ncbi:MAG: hypothetical protein AB7H80_05290 [Candidatus Kapaibacterium sp.]
MMSPSQRTLSLLTFLFLLLNSSGLYTQWRVRSHVGDPIGSPYITSNSVHLLNKDLLIDMRPLVTDKPVAITEKITVENVASATTTQLVFFAWSSQEAERYHVTLNGKVLTSEFYIEYGDTVVWKLPVTTPLRRSKRGILYSVDWSKNTGDSSLRNVIGGARLLCESFDPHTHYMSSFEVFLPVMVYQLELQPGKNYIEIEYRARAELQADSSRSELTWQLAYMARVQGRAKTQVFDSLDVTIYLPPQVEVATRPLMLRTGDTLHGSYYATLIPDFGITAQHSAVINQWQEYKGELSIWWLLLPALLSLVAGIWLGWRGRRLLSGFWYVLAAIVFSTFVSTFFLFYSIKKSVWGMGESLFVQGDELILFDLLISSIRFLGFWTLPLFGVCFLLMGLTKWATEKVVSRSKSM